MNETQEFKYHPIRDWILFTIWLLILYCTLPFGPYISGWYCKTFGADSITVIIWILFGLLAVGTILYKILRTKFENKLTYIYTIVVLLIYYHFISNMEQPVEKIHYIQYSLLAFLLLRSLRNHIRNRWIFLIAIVISYLVGVIDEFIQHLLPQRVGEYRDVLINLTASCPMILLIWFGTKFKFITQEWSARGAKIFLRITIITIICTFIFTHSVFEFGYKHKIDNITFQSRFQTAELKKMTETNFKSYQKILNSDTALNKNYTAFLKYQYVSRKYPYIHELRVHLFSRFLNISRYIHYKLMNDLANKNINPTIDNIKLFKYYNELSDYTDYLYHNKGLTKKEMLDKYINELKEKAVAINRGDRTPKTNEQLENYLFRAYNENVIIEQFYKKSVENTAFLWSETLKNSLKKLISDKKIKVPFQSKVSNDIITYMSYKTLVVIHAVLLLITIGILIKL